MQLSIDEEHVREQQKLLEIGVQFLLGVSNTRRQPKELDQGFAEYKPACDASNVTCDCLKNGERANGKQSALTGDGLMPVGVERNVSELAGRGGS